MNKIFNLKSQKHLRRQLRKQEIYSEKLLWKKLKNKQLGYKFRRQVGISNYVVDFYCPKLKLVIEIDGGTHADDDNYMKDKNRQDYIESLGLTVKRYNNSDIKNNMELVIIDIRQLCKEIAIKK